MANTSAIHNDDHDNTHGGKYTNEQPYHLVNPSPWPLLAATAFFMMTLGAAFTFHKTPYAPILLICGFALQFYVAFRWWRDCVREGGIDKAHTPIVRRGLRIGMALFILSEVMFFFAFFLSFFHSAFLPLDILDGAWPKIQEAGGVFPPAQNMHVVEGAFPPKDLKIVEAWNLPLFNTLLLLLSGTTVTWAHAALLEGNKRDLMRGLFFTIVLGMTFTAVQAFEYHHVYHEMFKISDNNYGSNFYMATGFHGLHVIIGTIFLIVCLIRANRNQFTPEHHLGFEFAAWYWHFVDVVWLFLFTFVYAWAGWGHTAH